jgi:hypothetical protein
MHTIGNQKHGFLMPVLRGLHLIGLAMFLGVIVANIVMNRYALNHGLLLLASARTLISLTSRVVLQGLALMAVTGVPMAALRYGGTLPAWLYAKMACVALIAANSLLFLLPAIDEATRWAAVSAQHNQPLPDFFIWLAREDRLGITNLLLFVFAGVLALWQPSLQRVIRRPNQ